MARVHVTLQGTYNGTDTDDSPVTTPWGPRTDNLLKIAATVTSLLEQHESRETVGYGSRIVAVRVDMDE